MPSSATAGRRKSWLQTLHRSPFRPLFYRHFANRVEHCGIGRTRPSSGLHRAQAYAQCLVVVEGMVLMCPTVFLDQVHERKLGQLTHELNALRILDGQ